MLVFICLHYGQTKNIYMAQGETLTRNYNFLGTSAEKVKHDRISEKIKEIIASLCLTGDVLRVMRYKVTSAGKVSHSDTEKIIL